MLLQDRHRLALLPSLPPSLHQVPDVERSVFGAREDVSVRVVEARLDGIGLVGMPKGRKGEKEGGREGRREG
jgi:hypothetical protein